MKTAEEILIEFGCPSVPFDENVTMYYPAILSAMDEYANAKVEEALRWRDPKEELPEKNYDVLVKIECETAGVFYLIGYTVEDNTWRLYYGDGINMESVGRTIVGWRNIIEP